MFFFLLLSQRVIKTYVHGNGYQKAFNEVDTDSSGYIDASEIKALLDKVAEAEGFEAPSEEAIQARKCC